ncbi:hypothetical protein H5410_031377 [Solanum commersonii]|uniref:Uncharacterized protein n=1 Tax=Solanum commersonii TaxID=4109 RepID=A0A9J5YJQ8_SOLCO|nr:hypothetical protein H5410_031377 [Solanum commersonii]
MTRHPRPTRGHTWHSKGGRKVFNKHSAIGESYINYIALRRSDQQTFKKINDVSCKGSTVATLVDFSDVDPVTRREFKTSALNGSEYFTSLEMARKIKSQMTLKIAIAEGNIASKLFDEFSHSGFNVGEYKNSTDSSILTKVNSLMVDATDMDEKLAMMEQTIEALKKPIDDKNLQITQLMSKLDLYNSGQSHHILTIQEKVDIDSATKPIDSQNANRSTSAFTRQKLKAIKAHQQMREVKNQSTLKDLQEKKYPFPDFDVPTILDELLTKKVIALPESKQPKESNKVDDPIEIAETNHASVKLDYDSISKVLRPVASPKIEEDVIILQFGSFEPVEVSALKKTTNTSKVDDLSNKKNDDTWILVACKRQNHQGTSKLRL